MQSKLITFQGNVKVDYNNITVRSPLAYIKTGDDGKPQDATFVQGANAVKIEAKSKDEVVANTIHLSLLDNKIKAEGDTVSVVSENQKPVAVIKADTQEYDMTNSIITATGSVVMDYKDIKTYSSTGRILIDKAGKLKEVYLAGNAKLIRDKNEVYANNFTYNMTNDELVAQGNTRSETILDDGTHVKVWSNIQQYVKATNTLMASGQVKIHYKDYDANGPKAMFFSSKKNANKPDKIIMIGRSKIKEEARIVEADRIEITMNPKDFNAIGNVKSKFTQVQGLDKNKTNQKDKKKDNKKLPAPVKTTKAPQEVSDKQQLKDKPKTDEVNMNNNKGNNYDYSYTRSKKNI